MASGEKGLVSRRLLDGRYRLEEELARGGTATVWRACDLRLERPVAVKLLTAVRSADPRMLARLRCEARILAGLTHPNIVVVHDLSLDSGRAYLVMELIEGSTLAARLADGPLPIGQAAAIAAATCDALAAAHAVGAIHRDIKPANIMLATTGTVKVVDFGIARLQMAGQATLTANSQVVGTSLYMAPEQATGATADARSDLYALGCVLYAMLTGAPPFTSNDPFEVLHQHLHQPLRPLRAQRCDVPPDLDRLVGELLDKDPTRRPATAGLVRDRLAAMSTHATSTHDGPILVPPRATPDPDTADLTAMHRPPTSPTLHQRLKPRSTVLLT
jgi:eukaryotic-like serine/threonine-protein kinase